MKLNQIADNAGSRKRRMRVGRGIGSGKGKTSGRGVKGQKSRTGVSIHGFEGGQMPLYRRLPKRGFRPPHQKTWQVVNLGDLQKAIDANKLDAGKPIDAAAMLAAGLFKSASDGVRLLGKGEIKTKIEVKVAGASASAIAAVEKAGGKVELPPKPVAEAA
ncbi:MAG TPA: 50S ribosomal protein L15 [Reyranella sp.]|jgi:large subunit ribosomal protein L15|nr:50S ribosomal protein L15 [Reyranella sp.]